MADTSRWPGGATLALSLVVNVEEGSEMSPRDGDRFYLAPDLPLAVQTIRLRAEGGNGAMPIWEVDGRPIGQGREVRWALLPGRHRIVARAPGVGERSVMIQVESAPR